MSESFVSPEEALDMLDVFDHANDAGEVTRRTVHTFLGGIGADWDLEDLEAEINRQPAGWPRRVASPNLGHGIAIRAKGSKIPLLLATKSEEASP